MTGNNKGNETESGYLYSVKTFPEKRSIVSLKVYNLSKASIKLQSSQYRPKKRIRISGTDSLATSSKKEETLSHNIDICQ
ncbi:MAG: hypothetical protein DWQ51_10530 [Microcystis wesenbergii TW10]|jgi:hypothetical protein|uniref:Uncharacterized protein n=3 Tax=Microcystis TaxID=1125 RepID=A0A552AXV5_MICAE|nr:MULTISPECIES: hypothetical protein [Microcystis]MCZ8037392.1 hypothetical protein [Microcystis sp. LE17-20A]MDT3675553.1 hypothetical protein [Microcystis wesenbergii NRERC-220]REJ52406.1 MAG: hypothetical protein DWQ51_10530 [Microcystis wesenbergii TW10]TRT90280.1 MAG: hypothetical protein EWV63_01620 [Microcystis aeruginosa Ma_OC_H_19870700_S124]